MRELELFFGPQHLGMVGNFSITLNVEGDRIIEPGSRIFHWCVE